MPWQREWGRDPRLDFFRGIAMFIIFIAHTPGNWVNDYIPARFGPSDAAEMFVFCSGFAAAIAFGGTFRRLGFWTGTARVLYRVWQLYWAQIALFLTVAMISVVATDFFPEQQPRYMDMLSMKNFFEHTELALVGLLTLSYLPWLFMMLPLYMVVLAMMPVVILLHRLHFGAVVAASLSLYLATWFLDLALPASPFADRAWFFNPFAWQLLFYTGFALSAGWLKGPEPNRLLIALAALYVLAWIPLSFWAFHQWWPDLADWRDQLLFIGTPPPAPLTGSFKSELHPARFLHLLCLTYLAICLLWGRERLLQAAVFRPIVKVGQQALPTFMTGLVLSWIGGIFLDQVGRTDATMAFVNLTGCLSLVAVAYGVGWYKAAPWSRKAAAGPAQTSGPAPIPTAAHPLRFRPQAVGAD